MALHCKLNYLSKSNLAALKNRITGLVVELKISIQAVHTSISMPLQRGLYSLTSAVCVTKKHKTLQQHSIKHKG